MDKLAHVVGGPLQQNFDQLVKDRDGLDGLVAALTTRVAALEANLTGLRIVRGAVASGGTIVSGTGFSITKNGTGDYTVTFASAFSTVPACLVTAGATAANLTAKHHASTVPTVNAFRVLVFITNTVTAADGAFHFAAVELP